jgi:hypothetical protein
MVHPGRVCNEIKSRLAPFTPCPTHFQRDVIKLKQKRYLDDVNFSTSWPRALPRDGPERWPGGTPVRHMLEVKDDDRFVKGLLRTDPIAVSSARLRVDDIREIREHEELAPGSCAGCHHTGRPRTIHRKNDEP